jgi:hypothetical protein
MAPTRAQARGLLVVLAFVLLVALARLFWS